MKNACLSVILLDQVGDDVKDTVYQIGGGDLVHPVIPDTSGIAFKGSNAIPARRPEWQDLYITRLRKVITHIVIPAPDQVDDDVKDTVY